MADLIIESLVLELHRLVVKIAVILHIVVAPNMQL